MSDGPRLLPGPAHFIVEEEPAYLPEGAGEHLYVQIEKEGLTTEAVAEALAKACGKHQRDVGYAGRKDRHAITRQWFSLHFGREEQLVSLADHLRNGRATVLSISRHRNKLRLGHLAGNRFRLGLADIDELAVRDGLTRLLHDGIRHRFGSQRFGVNGATLRIARAWGAGDLEAAVAAVLDPSDHWRWGDPTPDGWRGGAEGRVLGAVRQGASARSALAAGGDQLAKLIASAAQSAVFNAILAARASDGLLHVLRAGDIACTTKGAPFVVSEADLADVNRRAAPGVLDLRATAPLPGDLRLRPSPEREAEERAWSATTGVDWAWFERGGRLESLGERRPLLALFRAPPELTRDGDLWQLSLSLPSGCYATEVLDQLGIAVPADRRG